VIRHCAVGIFAIRGSGKRCCDSLESDSRLNARRNVNKLLIHGTAGHYQGHAFFRSGSVCSTFPRCLFSFESPFASVAQGVMAIVRTRRSCASGLDSFFTHPNPRFRRELSHANVRATFAALLRGALFCFEAD
jgi:hypothetical protein